MKTSLFKLAQKTKFLAVIGGIVAIMYSLIVEPFWLLKRISK